MFGNKHAMIANWSVLCASIEHITRYDTQLSELVSDTRERPDH